MPGDPHDGTMKMKTILGPALAVALMFSSGAALALDKVNGNLTGIDLPSGQFMIKVNGDADNLMNFRIAQGTDVQKFLEGFKDGDKVTVAYDQAECGSDQVCVSTAGSISVVN